MEIKCIITDDEPIARKGLKSYVEKIDFLTLIGECENALQLNSLLKTEKTDLLFLDIEMPLLSGLDFLDSLQHPPKVILTTAYEQYALKGYELDVVDYLLKPITFERFVKAVNKAADLFEKVAKTNEEAYIFVRSDKQYKKIFLDDILFLESMDNYVIIYTPDSKEIIHGTLKSILDSLPDNCFLQVHRSYVVNLKHIRSIEGNQLLVGSHKVTVARNLREEVYKIILNNRLISK